MNTLIRGAILLVVLVSLSVCTVSAQTELKEGNSLQQLTKINFALARKTALDRVHGHVIEAGLEIENGLLVYSFDIKTPRRGVTEVQINAKNGTVVLVKQETVQEERAEAARDHNPLEDKKGALERTEQMTKQTTTEESTEEPIHGTIAVKKHFQLKKLARISLADARKSALQMVEGKVKEVELENENGFLVYNVSILFNRQEWEVLVDAGSGLVLTVDTDD